MPLLRRRFPVARLLFTAALLPATALALPVAPVTNGAGACALAVVDGRPAIAWVENSSRTVNYVRALDATGTAWGTPVTLAVSPTMKLNLSLRAANGRPAVCCFDATDLYFIRANDAAGDSWAPARTLGTGTSQAVMEVIDGNFAILTWNGNILEYLRATDPDAATWSPRVLMSTRPCTGEFALTEIQGRPAAVLSASPFINGIWYARALDAAGSAWPPSQMVNPLLSTKSFSMRSVGGNPAFTFHAPAGTDSNLTYVRGTNPDGAAWSPPVTLATGIPMPLSLAAQSSLAVVNGSPAVVFLSRLGDTTRALNYVQAKDGLGDPPAAWNAPVVVDDGRSTGLRHSLAEVDGHPAIACMDVTRSSLTYLRAVDAGGVLWPPEIRVHSSAGLVPDGGSTTFGTVAVGTTATLHLTVLNPRSSSTSFSITGVTLDGPDAAEFSILQFPDTPVPGGGATEIVVRYAPLTAGTKTAALQITIDAGLPYDITLTGNSAPEIAVQLSGGRTLAHGATVHVPWMPPGTPASLVFLVRNPGGAELKELAVTIDAGPQSSEFTVTVPPARAVPPGGCTSFTLRHLAQTAGNKFADLQIASNLAGAGSLFIVNLSVERGAVDETFAPSFGIPSAAGGVCQGIAVEPDGRILAGGSGFLRALHPDGTDDNSFFAPAFTGTVLSIAVQRDGRILLGGKFNDRGSYGLMRIFPDGTLDTGFKPDVSGEVYCMEIQQDGKILAGGAFVSGAGSAYHYLVRLLPGGSVDTTFKPGLDQQISALIPLPDGTVLAGGWFTNGSTPVNPYLSRFHPDGSGDAFPWRITSPVEALAWRPDGFILAAQSTGILVQLQPDGTLVPGDPVIPIGFNWSLAMQTNGECVGAADAHLFRVGVNGNRDAGSFAAQPIHIVEHIALQADGKVLIGGMFTRVGNVFQSVLARLTNDPAFNSLTWEGSDALRWMRSGTSPEVSDVSFEMNTPGDSEWTLLGWGTRIPGGWELAGLDLSDTCQIRAIGRAGGSLMQSLATFSGPPALEAWRLEFFGTTDNTGDAADDADPDLDGLTNAVEFAFGTSPVDGGSNALPEFKLTGGEYTAAFTAPQGRDDVIYGAEWSPSMQPGTWTGIPDTGTGIGHEFRAPGAGRVFVRFIVRMQ